MAKEGQKDRFLTTLTSLGGSAGNGKLREALGWGEWTYDSVKRELIDDGKIVLGRGRGGSVALASEGSAPRPTNQAAQVDRRVRAAIRPNTTAANVGSRPSFGAWPMRCAIAWTQPNTSTWCSG